MIRISTIFIAICMVLVAASLGLILYSVAGISGTESAIVALTALTFLILYNAVSMRLRDRTDVGSQIADLSRGTADLARQVAEFGRRLAAIEGKVVSANSAGADRIQAVAGEISELGALVKQLAVSVASHDDMLAANAAAAAAAAPASKAENERQQELPLSTETVRHVTPLPPLTAVPTPAAVASPPAPSRGQTQILAAVKSAVDENRIEIYLQPMVTLPQRKVRFY
ncbi:MAG: EAL domain-containing protein, partial [Bradyrhizobium sp.]